MVNLGLKFNTGSVICYFSISGPWLIYFEHTIKQRIMYKNLQFPQIPRLNDDLCYNIVYHIKGSNRGFSRRISRRTQRKFDTWFLRKIKNLICFIMFSLILLLCELLIDIFSCICKNNTTYLPVIIFILTCDCKYWDSVLKTLKPVILRKSSIEFYRCYLFLKLRAHFCTGLGNLCFVHK